MACSISVILYNSASLSPLHIENTETTLWKKLLMIYELKNKNRICLYWIKFRIPHFPYYVASHLLG